MATNRRLPVAIRFGKDYDFDEADFHVKVALHGAETFAFENNKARAGLGEVNSRYAKLDDVGRKQLQAIGEIMADIEAQIVRPVIAPRRGEEGTVEGALIQALLILRSYSQRGFDRWLGRENRFLARGDEKWGALANAWQELTLDEDRAYGYLRWIKEDGWESIEDSWKRLALALAEFTVTADLSTELLAKAALAKVAIVQAKVEAAGIDNTAFVAVVEAERERLSAPDEEPAAATPTTTSEA